MKRILIIEDDRAIAELERDYLEANDYEVEICEDGESGLKRALQEDFALILLDVMLPKEDGFQVCRNLRASKMYRSFWYQPSVRIWIKSEVWVLVPMITS